MKKKFRVTINKSYIKLFFDFADMEQAGIFIQTVLTTYKRNDKDDEDADKKMNIEVNIIEEEEG